MLLIRFLACQLGANDRDERTAGIGNVVDRIKYNRDRIGHESDHSFKSREKYIGYNPDNAGFYDRFLTGYLLTVCLVHFLYAAHSIASRFPDVYALWNCLTLSWCICPVELPYAFLHAALKMSRFL